MNSTLTFRRFAFAAVVLVLGFTALFGTGCAAQGGSRKPSTPHRRVLAQADLRGRQAERMPLRIQVVGNHTEGVVKILDGARVVTVVAPGEIQMLYVNEQWREHSPRVMIGIQKPGRPIVVVPFQFHVVWQDDYVHASTPIQTKVLTLVDGGTREPSGIEIIQSR